jgi:flavodoxin
MIKTLVLYESRYGSTKNIAKELALVLGPARAFRVSEYSGNPDCFDFVVLCSPVYSEAIDPAMLAFAEKNAEILRGKRVVLVCICMAETQAKRYLEPLRRLLGESVELETSAQGVIDAGKLCKGDRELIEEFCAKTDASPGRMGGMSDEKLSKLCLAIKAIKERHGNIREESLVKRHMEDFLSSHNTCVLATGSGSRVRATPIEYLYIDGFIYMLSEGGEKFANILVNPNVSIGICDPYRNMTELGGMQISGTAVIVEVGSEEYKLVLKERNLDFEKISSMPMALNMLKIGISKIEFLWLGYSKLGCDVRQTIYSEGGKI